MHNKDKVIFNKKLSYEYNIYLYFLEELCDKGVIDVFEMTEAIVLLRKKYKMPVISIYGKKDNNSSDLEVRKRINKKVSPEHKLRVCAYVRVSTILGECLL